MNSLTHLTRLAATALVVTLTASVSLDAQVKAGGTQPQLKGILEPVSFTEDIDFSQVYFVSPEVGWVSGDHGTILRTTNGGKSWEAQLGGDPADKSEKIDLLHFLDERRGWAIQGLKTLHTRDGESWEEIGSAPYTVEAMAFTTPRTGFLTGGATIYDRGPTTMYRTTDGGRSWKPQWTCAAKVAMGGLTKNLACEISQLQFPTPQVGYGAARAKCLGTCGPPLLVKTTDGGESWQVLTGPGVIEEDQVTGIFFTDENTGFARLASKKLHMTTDGGRTWRGIVASPGADIQFADPSVGWGVELGYVELKLSFTTDGGKRWSSREVRLPAPIRAFSLPRRDRAYVVGDHGMIFRYRVVPMTAAMVPNGVVAPAMPAFESPLDEQVAQLETVLQEISTELESFTPPAASGGVTPAGVPKAFDPAADSAAVWNEPFEAPLPPASGITANCCKKSFNHLELALGLVSQSLPDFISRYKNLNLLLAAVRMGSEMPDEYRSVKGGLRAFRRAQDKASAKAALAEVTAALAALKQTTAVAMQQQLPPPVSPDGEAFNNAGAASSASRQPAADAKAKPAAKNDTKDAVKDAAKKGLGGLLRKKIP